MRHVRAVRDFLRPYAFHARNSRPHHTSKLGRRASSTAQSPSSGGDRKHAGRTAGTASESVARRASASPPSPRRRGRRVRHARRAASRVAVRDTSAESGVCARCCASPADSAASLTTGDPRGSSRRQSTWRPCPDSTSSVTAPGGLAALWLMVRRQSRDHRDRRFNARHRRRWHNARCNAVPSATYHDGCSSVSGPCVPCRS